jgi:hypothetical protein
VCASKTSDDGEIREVETQMWPVGMLSLRESSGSARGVEETSLESRKPERRGI